MILHNNKSGFTLLEVLIALVILALAFSAVFVGISTYARNLLYLQNKTAASWVALNVIAEAQLQVDIQTQPKQQLMFNQMWFWTAVIKPTPNPSVQQIDVEVRKTPESGPLIHLIGYKGKT